MTRKLKGGAIQANTVTANQISSTITNQANNSYAQANLAYAQANAAYSRANTANTAAAGASGGFAKSFLVGL